MGSTAINYMHMTSFRFKSGFTAHSYEPTRLTSDVELLDTPGETLTASFSAFNFMHRLRQIVIGVNGAPGKLRARLNADRDERFHGDHASDRP